MQIEWLCILRVFVEEEERKTNINKYVSLEIQEGCELHKCILKYIMIKSRDFF